MQWKGHSQGLPEIIQGHATDDRRALEGLQSPSYPKYESVIKKVCHLDHHKKTSLYDACPSILVSWTSEMLNNGRRFDIFLSKNRRPKIPNLIPLFPKI